MKFVERDDRRGRGELVAGGDEARENAGEGERWGGEGGGVGGGSQRRYQRHEGPMQGRRHLVALVADDMGGQSIDDDRSVARTGVETVATPLAVLRDLRRCDGD